MEGALGMLLLELLEPPMPVIEEPMPLVLDVLGMLLLEPPMPVIEEPMPLVLGVLGMLLLEPPSEEPMPLVLGMLLEPPMAVFMSAGVFGGAISSFLSPQPIEMMAALVRSVQPMRTLRRFIEISPEGRAAEVATRNQRRRKYGAHLRRRGRRRNTGSLDLRKFRAAGEHCCIETQQYREP